MATRSSFTEEEMSINEGLGYPKAYAKLCRSSHLFNPYNDGPPSTFIPYMLQKQQALRAKELNHMFPIIDPDRKPSANARNYASLLWKQLDHLGNAGFDPAKFRVDTYGNVLYIHADSGSPLSWEITHWFPCSRGGITVPSNLRVLQWQVCRKMQNKLEFLIPWWDLQLGVSVNQFLSIFASKNSDFRSRAFSFLFLEGETEELSASQCVESHRFPQHFIDAKRQVGLAPAAIVSLHSDFDTSTLKSLDLNRPLRSNSPAVAARKFSVEDNEAICTTSQHYGVNALKESDKLDMGNSEYAVIAIARNSLKHKKETEKKQEEMHKLEEELNELKQRNEMEQLAIQDLESVLLKYRKKVEKCKHLADAQSSYKVVLEKMIRDAMHQSVVYKEQIRLNQAANRTLMARLEVQRAICDSSEKDIHRQLKQRDEIENQIRPYCEQARKRSRMDDTQFQERHKKTIHFIRGTRARKPSYEELSLVMAKAGTSLDEEREHEEEEEEKNRGPLNNANVERPAENQSLIVVDNEIQKLATKDSYCQKTDQRKSVGPVPQTPREEDDEEYARKLGKEKIDKWLMMLLDNTQEDPCPDSPPQNTDELDNMPDKIVQKLNLRNPQKEIEISRLKASKEVDPSQNDSLEGVKLFPKGTRDFKCSKLQAEGRHDERCSKMFAESNTNEVGSACSSVRSSKDFEVGNERVKMNGKGRRVVGSASGGAFRSIPSSPSVILGMRRGVDCMGKKPLIVGGDEGVMANKFFKTPITQAIKKALKK